MCLLYLLPSDAALLPVQPHGGGGGGAGGGDGMPTQLLPAKVALHATYEKESFVAKSGKYDELCVGTLHFAGLT